ncbi:siderophore biosynthesis protein [Terrihabitans soli]|uniref:Siderophore biosynthesis protein n=1 Tax=Terrihabitans soli TaxID=708113 RepID=A0A6S6QS92_9HYPH|nr:ferric iron reductase [Terrihabitans soli]BCJ90575.1 siderophore biosynthesis protein [Terrihabitans soli]
MDRGPEFERTQAADDVHPLHAALRAQAKLMPTPSYGIGPVSDGFAPAAYFFANGDFLERMLDRQQSMSRGLDRKGAAAYLIVQYASLFSATAVVPFVAARIVPDLSPENYALLFTPEAEEGKRVAVRLQSARFTTDIEENSRHSEAEPLVDAAGLRESLRLAIEDHFTPLIDALHDRTKLSRNALWRLVGDSIAARFLDAGEKFSRIEDAKTDAMAVLKQTGSPLKNRQLGYFDITIRDEHDPERIILTRTFRARGGCCRAYKVEGGELCTICVLRDPEERNRDIEDRIRRRLRGENADEHHAH